MTPKNCPNPKFLACASEKVPINSISSAESNAGLRLGQKNLGDALADIRRDTGFLVFSFPQSLGSGIYDEINGGQRKLVRTYLGYISTKFQPIWMRFGAHVSKTPCQTLYPWVSVLARCFAYACTKSHPNRSKFGGDIAQINAHRFLLSPINFVINSTSQRPWEQKGQKTRVTPYQWKAAFITNEGLFEPMVMFFSLTNSPATFQMMMNAIFEEELHEG